ncbi:hypothetical protein AWF13_16650 [Escherichia coli]|nr:hypothetical protein AWF13_16650 [Escherichia coli]
MEGHDEKPEKISNESNEQLRWLWIYQRRETYMINYSLRDITVKLMLVFLLNLFINQVVEVYHPTFLLDGINFIDLM